MKGSTPAQVLYKKGIMVAAVWYRVKACMNEGPHSRCERCCGWGHIENKCGNKPTCVYCSGDHQTSDHKCNLVGYTVKHGSLCRHTLEQSPNFNGKYIAFSNRCTMKAKATRAARQCRKIRQWPSTNAATDMSTGPNRVVHGP